MGGHYNGSNAAKGVGVSGPTRVALYVRFSTDEQRENGSSLADRRRVLEEHAGRKGFVTVEEVADEGLSGRAPTARARAHPGDRSGSRDSPLAVHQAQPVFPRPLPSCRFKQDLARHRVRLVMLEDLDREQARFTG